MATTSAAPVSAPPPAAPTAATATERGADGWPSAETPRFLIPGMGELPVSSTAHFRTVLMTSLGDAELTDRLWPRLRGALLRALGHRGSTEAAGLVVHKAVYGDFALNLGDLPTTTPVDVGGKVLPFVSDDGLTFRVDSQALGDPAPGRAKLLEVVVQLAGQQFTRRVAEHGILVVPETLRIDDAEWGEHSGDPTDNKTINVTDFLRTRVSGNRRLSIRADNASFGTSFDTGRPRTLRVQHTIDGVSGSTNFPEGMVNLPGPLTLVSARYGEFLAPRTIDVTDKVAALVNPQGMLDVEASALVFGDPAPGIVKKLRVDFSLNGVPGSRVVQDGERLALKASASQALDATAIHQLLFEPPPASVADLARRLSQRGLKAVDLDATAVDATMEEVLDKLVGLAPDDQLDPLLASADAVDSPAEGVLLHHEQGWFARGMALGNLLHSVALAPGEVTQIAMTHWNHSTRATDSETVSQEDSTAESDTQDRSVSEIQRAAADEHAFGASVASSTAASAQAGISSFFGSASAAANSSLTTAVNRSDGSRNLAMDSNQRIAAASQRHAEAARTRRATVVREVTQSEDQTLTTRVLANYNHMHALTVMYFEVIEVFDLKTRVVDAERLVFLPFKVRDVLDLVPRWRPVLIDAANAVGRADLAEAFRRLGRSDAPLRTLEADITRLDGTVAAGDASGKRSGGEIQHAQDRRLVARAAVDAVLIRFASQRTVLQARITELDAQRAQVVAAFHAVPDVLGSIVAQAVQAQFRALDEKVTGVRQQIDADAAAEQRALADARADLADSERQLEALQAQSRQLHATLQVLETPTQTQPGGALADNRLYFNQAVWLSLSPAEVLGLARRRGRFQGELLAEQIDPAPVAVTGNSVAYRWRIDDAQRAEKFRRQHVVPPGDEHARERELATVTATIAAPTGGVFGEAVLGQAVSAEKIDLSRFWNWQDSMIPILPTGIGPLNAATPSVQNLSAEPGKLDESSAKLGALAALPTPSGFKDLAETLRTQLVRDMSGQSLVQALAAASTQAAASGSAAAAEQASKNFAASLTFAKDIAPTVLEALAAPETGGLSLLAGKLGAGTGGGTSLLGGLLSAGGAKGAGDLLSGLAGGKGSVTKTADKTAEKVAPAKGKKAPKPLPKIPVSKEAEPVPPAPADPPAG